MSPRNSSHNRLTPDQRALAGRIGALESWATTPDRRARTERARAAAWSRYEQQVDPDRVLSDAERLRRAKYAQSAHMSRLALRSSLSRAKAKRARLEAARLDADARAADRELAATEGDGAA